MNRRHFLSWSGAAVVAAVVGGGCRRKDIRTHVIRVPQMVNEACATRVVEALSTDQHLPMGNIRADVAQRTVTVTYDTMKTATKNIEFAIAGAGFAANDVPADAEAARKLPAACRE